MALPDTPEELSPLQRLSSIFWANSPSDPGAVNQLALRQRIAMAMMQQKRAYPKTFGEGLAAIGDALGDRGMMSQMLAADAAQQKSIAGEQDPAALPSTSKPTSYEPTDDGADSTASALPKVITDGTDQPATTASSPQLGDIVANLESGGGKANASQPANMVDKTYGQYPAFAQQYGSGVGGVNNYAQQVLKANPDATLQDMYSGYVLGTGNPAKPPTVADLQTKYPSAYNNLIKNAGVPPDTPLASLLGQQRDRVAAAAMPPPPSPVAATSGGLGPDQRLAFNGTPTATPVPSNITPAPPVQPQITPLPTPPAPPQQLAQSNNAPPPQFGFVRPEQPAPVRPTPTPISPREAWAQDMLRKYQNDPNAQLRWNPVLAEEQAKRKFADQQNETVFLKQWDDYQRNQDLRTGDIKGRAADIATGQKLTSEADVAQRYGGLPIQTVMEPVVKSADQNKGLPAAVMATANARAALNAGIISGAGADQKLLGLKTRQALGALVGINGDDPRIANTEAFKAAIMPIVAQLRSATSGNANISDADIKMALDAAAGNISLDAKTFPRVLDAIERVNLGQAIFHQQKVQAAAGGNPQAATVLQGTYGVPMETLQAMLPPHIIQRLREHPETAGELNAKMRTPGLAEFILRQQ